MTPLIDDDKPRRRNLKYNLTGQRFARWLVIREHPERRHGAVLWECLCDCGGTSLVTTGALRNGGSGSCGCRNREAHRETHGGSRRSGQHPLYTTWVAMRRRCREPKDSNYPNYGGRGIAVCERWENFALFVEDVGERPDGTTLDRIDNDGNYEPGNVRWATPLTQSANRRPTFKITEEMVREIRRRRAGGETHLAIAQAVGISPSHVRNIVHGRAWQWVI